MHKHITLMITAKLSFENFFPPEPFVVYGEATLIDTNGEPTNIIQTDDVWKVKFEWTQKGKLAKFMSEENQWHLEVILEEMGHGETSFKHGEGKKYVPFVCKDPFTYKEIIVIPGGVVKEGIYRIVVCLTFTGKGGRPNAEIAAFAEFGLVKFYDAH